MALWEDWLHPSHRMESRRKKKWNNHHTRKRWSAGRHRHKVTAKWKSYQFAVEDLESSVLFPRHMQCGHGKLYIESFGLLSSTPLESLCDLMISSCRLRLFHLENNHRRTLQILSSIRGQNNTIIFFSEPTHNSSDCLN